jgi:hypothetical protein|tara:strand:+ start:2165 stop:2560 length:396 start_codon:yes stop_codon:yes gene_type:complete
MSKIIIGTVFVFGASGFYLLKNMKSIQAMLEEKYGRKIMDGVGYLGGALQLGAVVAVSRGWLANTDPLYHGISLVGSSGLLATAYYHDALAPVLVNLIWMGMNTVGILEGISNTQAIIRMTDASTYVPTAA